MLYPTELRALARGRILAKKLIKTHCLFLWIRLLRELTGFLAVIGINTVDVRMQEKLSHALVTPGILVGLFGYAVATFIGIGFTALLK